MVTSSPQMPYTSTEGSPTPSCRQQAPPPWAYCLHTSSTPSEAHEALSGMSSASHGTRRNISFITYLSQKFQTVRYRVSTQVTEILCLFYRFKQNNGCFMSETVVFVQCQAGFLGSLQEGDVHLGRKRPFISGPNSTTMYVHMRNVTSLHLRVHLIKHI